MLAFPCNSVAVFVVSFKLEKDKAMMVKTYAKTNFQEGRLLCRCDKEIGPFLHK